MHTCCLVFLLVFSSIWLFLSYIVQISWMGSHFSMMLKRFAQTFNSEKCCSNFLSRIMPLILKQLTQYKAPQVISPMKRKEFSIFKNFPSKIQGWLLQDTMQAGPDIILWEEPCVLGVVNSNLPGLDSWPCHLLQGESATKWKLLSPQKAPY